MATHENRSLELKREVTNTFLKTVSAFANYGSGTIIFGIDDDGTVLGVKDPDATMMQIEQKINDSISPRPQFTLNARPDGTVELTVAKGDATPYLFKGHAYIRGDSSTVEVDTTAYGRLVLEGANVSFDETRARNQDLHFTALGARLADNLGITVDMNTLKTLQLFDDQDGYTVAAELLSDENSFPGIDMVRFGENVEDIFDRVILDGMSILQQYDEATAIFQKYYQVERVIGARRERVELIPLHAFREAVANALVHRTWDVRAAIRVAMYPDRVTITSTGGVDRENYLRNPIVGNVFFRLGIIEQLGTGIARIQRAYAQSVAKPHFDILDTSITVSLPLLHQEHTLQPDTRTVYNALLPGQEMKRALIEERSGLPKMKVLAALEELIQLGSVTTTGAGPTLKYVKV